MQIGIAIIGVLLIFLIAQDGFETIILPRHISRKFRLTQLYYSITWLLWSGIARRMKPGNRREQFLGYYGPLSLLLLLGIWGVVFIFGFALLYWGITAPLNTPDHFIDFGTYLYMSGTTFVTLGLGDVTPLTFIAREIVSIEAGLGLAFLALVIGYVPILYQSFSKREISISLLDARAGSPPMAVTLLARHSQTNFPAELIDFLRDWERWCGELLESHISYPVLNYYRSQHERQSWLAALTMLLDTCALALVGIEGLPVQPMKFIFAIARHTAVDLAQTYGTPPLTNAKRLSAENFKILRGQLEAAGLHFTNPETAERHLAEIRYMYEPFLVSLSDHLLIPIPEWTVDDERIDDWQTSAWDHFLQSTPRTIDRAIRSE